MILLTFNAWIGPGRLAAMAQATPVEPIERHVAFASRLDVTEALRGILNYRDAYNKRFHPHIAVNFTLLGVASVPDPVPDMALFRAVGVELIENLSIDPD